VSAPVFVEERPVGGRRVEAIADVVIGREGCDVVLADPEVSRRHALVRVVAGGGVAIEDLGSTNGTFVNERRVEGVVALRDGDSVRFGNTVWRLRAPAAPPTILGGGGDGAADATAARAVVAAAGAPITELTAASPQAIGPRGDVPAPPERPPSAIHAVLPTPAAGEAPAFNPPQQRGLAFGRGGSAATRDWATVACLVFALAVAVALVLYFGSQ
jgi:FHA domain